MKIAIHTISFAKHFHWLRHNLRSIAKYATGFSEVSVWVPDVDFREMEKLAEGYSGSIPLKVTPYKDWPEKGFLKHMDLVLHGDQCCPEADYVMGLDSDCIFIEPVKPEDYFVNGKPVLMYASYAWLGKIEPAILYWQEACRKALGWIPEYEFMRRPCSVHGKETFLMTRQIIERNTGLPISDYVQAQTNSFPQSLAEYPALGSVAWRFLSDRYHWINQEIEVRPRDKILQGWSHADDLNAPLDIWHADQKIKIVPNEVFAKYL